MRICGRGQRKPCTSQVGMLTIARSVQLRPRVGSIRVSMAVGTFFSADSEPPVVHDAPMLGYESTLCGDLDVIGGWLGTVLLQARAKATATS
jgi:hypothetical protein